MKIQLQLDTVFLQGQGGVPEPRALGEAIAAELTQRLGAGKQSRYVASRPADEPLGRSIAGAIHSELDP